MPRCTINLRRELLLGHQNLLLLPEKFFSSSILILIRISVMKAANCLMFTQPSSSVHLKMIFLTWLNVLIRFKGDSISLITWMAEGTPILFAMQLFFSSPQMSLEVIVLKHVVFQLSLFLKFCFGFYYRRFLYFILQLTLACFKK